MKFSQPTKKKRKEKLKISQTRNKLKWETKKRLLHLCLPGVYTISTKKALLYDPTSADHQSSFIENWWLLTGASLCNEIKKCLNVCLIKIGR